PGSQSLAVQRDLERRFANQFPTTALVTVHDETRTVDDPALRAVIEGVAARVGAVPGVGGVQSFASTGSPAFVSPDRRTTSLVAAGLPIMLALVSLGVTLGALYFLAGITDMNVYVTNTASIVGIGVGIDYALFVVTRFREELRRGRPVAEAVPLTLATSGRAVALSGATVIVALAGMFLVDIQAFRSMAIGSMSVVAVAVLAAITLLPAVLSAVGPRVNRLRLPFTARAEAVDGQGSWHRWALAVMRPTWSMVGALPAIRPTLP